jgi:type II secretory pathway component PulF
MRFAERIKTVLLTPVHARSETYYVLENLAILLSSGTDILSALGTIKESMPAAWIRQKIDALIGNIDSGLPFWRALALTKLLPARMVTLIKIGEEAGRLPENLSLLVMQAQKERLFRSRLQSAMLYPMLVLIITSVVGIGISWFILPRLTKLFSELNVELPIMTRILMFFGNLLDRHGVIVSATLAGLIVALIYIFFVNQKTKVAGQWLVFHIPGIKRLAQEVEIARFGYLFGTLLTAGLPLVDALRSLTEATPFRRYAKLYRHLAATVEEGRTITDAFRVFKNSPELIPLPIQQMFTAAWNSGRMPETSLSIGKIFEEKIEVTTKNISTLLEPILLVIVWLGVVNVALAVIMPIYKLIGNLNNPQGIASVQKKPGKAVTVPPATPPAPKPARKIATVATVSQLNVRKDPSSQSPVVTKIPPKTTYPVIEETSGWVKIILPNDTTGWVNAAYVTLETE